ncbi:MAG: redox-sensing transcriptional repressor Rex [Clostridia bacterium]|nr:redox-sensing transcriptional repressor Rex [Clostridia bacterium]
MEFEEYSPERPITVSPAVVKRLPRYYRYLRELITQGRMRISSGELSAMMNVTASQIRQDLNCFGGFGQQGYGYNVNYLFARISEILGVGEGFHAIIIGAGDLGRALVHLSMFEKRGVDIIGMFDTGEGQEGTAVAGVDVLPLSALEDFCEKNPVDIAVITCPKEQVKAIADRLVACGVKGLWNYMGVELKYSRREIAVENVHLGDSLMILNYKIASRDEELRELEHVDEHILDSDAENETK